MEIINVKEIRAKSGLSKRDFANKLGISPDTVTRYEKGSQPKKIIANYMKCIFPMGFSDDEISLAGIYIRQKIYDLEVDKYHLEELVKELAAITNNKTA